MQFSFNWSTKNLPNRNGNTTHPFYATYTRLLICSTKSYEKYSWTIDILSKIAENDLHLYLKRTIPQVFFAYFATAN